MMLALLGVAAARSVPAGCAADLRQLQHLIDTRTRAEEHFPRVIHQNWLRPSILASAVPPAHFSSWIRSWRELHPAYEYLLWSAEATRTLIADKYSWFLATYDGYDQAM